MIRPEYLPLTLACVGMFVLGAATVPFGLVTMPMLWVAMLICSGVQAAVISRTLLTKLILNPLNNARMALSKVYKIAKQKIAALRHIHELFN